MPYSLLSGIQNNHIEVFHVILHGERYVVAVAIVDDILSLVTPRKAVSVGVMKAIVGPCRLC